VAIKNADAPSQPAKKVLLFQEKAAEFFKKAGGAIIGADEDLVTACFGSPLERMFLAGQKEASPYEGNINADSAPALKAVDLVSEIAKHPECASWHFGLDIGDCTFAWSALSGYSAFGTPVQQARIFSRIVSRYKAGIIISGAVLEAIPDLPVKKLDELKTKNIREPFYGLAVKKP
jgi:class 3 adenylate cyclase